VFSIAKVKSFHKVIPNNEEYLRKEFSKFSSPEKALVIIENTGGYERKAIKVLLEIGFKIEQTIKSSKAFVR
jgi:transposase